MRMSSGPLAEKAKPLAAASSWREETPRSRSTPETVPGAMPASASARRTSAKVAWTGMNRPAASASASRARAVASASGSRSMPTTTASGASASSSAAVWPPPPSVPST